MCGRASASHEAAVLCGGGQHTAGSLSRGGARVRAGWRPAEAAGGPICRPLLVVSKGAKTFTIQVGQRQEIVSVDRLKPHTAWVQFLLLRLPLAAALPGCRPLLLSSLHLHEAADWGGPLWRIVFSYVNIFIHSMCLANCGSSEAVYPCNVVEKIHEYYRSKMRQYL
jgi:hypothetical protein